MICPKCGSRDIYDEVSIYFPELHFPECCHCGFKWVIIGDPYQSKTRTEYFTKDGIE